MIEELRKRSQYLVEKRHDTLPLIIWNYNNKCTFDDAWDEYTMMARGLITDLKGNIIARPFKKFFNLNQREQDSIKNLPLDTPVVYEKLDGSMGIQYYDEDRVCIATRGSFNSDQAQFGTDWMKKFSRSDFNSKYTYIYEVIYPENRIVVNYGNRSELVLLAVIETQTGEEVEPLDEAKRLRLNYAKYFPINDINKLVELTKILPGDQEGFVVKYPNNYRVKIKGEDYLRLHRLITGFSTKSIWECLKDGTSFDEVLTNVPDEFYNWIMEKKIELEIKFAAMRSKADVIFKYIDPFQDRKSQAIWINQHYKEMSGILFAMLNGKDPDKIIWKQLKPVYELPFFNQTESE